MIVWAIIIFLLILMPGKQMPDMGDLFSFDKLAHLGVFCVLCFLMIIGFTKQHQYPKLAKSAIKYSLIYSLIYAGSLELMQALIPGRYANYYDLAFNLLGVITGILLFLLVYKLPLNRAQFK